MFTTCFDFVFSFLDCCLFLVTWISENLLEHKKYIEKYITNNFISFGFLFYTILHATKSRKQTISKFFFFFSFLFCQKNVNSETSNECNRLDVTTSDTRLILNQIQLKLTNLISPLKTHPICQSHPHTHPLKRWQIA